MKYIAKIPDLHFTCENFKIWFHLGFEIISVRCLNRFVFIHNLNFILGEIYDFCIHCALMEIVRKYNMEQVDYGAQSLSQIIHNPIFDMLQPMLKI